MMEYVKGMPITDYCDAMGLSGEERLNPFIQVCSALQHAHQKGIPLTANSAGTRTQRESNPHPT